MNVNAVRLQRAVLCADCEVISDSPHDACLVCGSHSLLPLARVLNKMSAKSSSVAKPEQQETTNNVLVLISPVPHRSPQRSRR